MKMAADQITSIHAVPPQFMKDKRVQLSVDTSGYCQARCALCVWPYLTPTKRTMTMDEYAIVLERFSGLEFTEFAFNSVNEPFADPTIIEKMRALIDSGLKVNSLFFSSNWLIPKNPKIATFVSVIDAAINAASISAISINATVSGIDQAGYDKYQAGRDLEHTVAKYRPLNFSVAVRNIIALIGGLSTTIPIGESVVVRIKAYGDDFDPLTYDRFWRETLDAAGIDRQWVTRHVKPVVNHALTTFARSGAQGRDGVGKCQMAWLDNKLVVGPDGSLGLCCQEGARKVRIGSLLTQSLEDVIESDLFQKQLAIVRGELVPEADHLCRSCEWYTIPAT